ncbi:MAG: L,D-transpeptidase family protein [Dermatophilaceae bacterium]
MLTITRGRALLSAGAAVPLVLGGTGTAYAVHYQERALPGSSISGISVAGMTRSEVAAVVRERAAATTVTVRTGSGTRTDRLAELGVTVDADATVDAVFAANRSWSSYATSLVSEREVDAVVRTDAARMDAVVAELVGQVGRPVRNASVRLAPDQASFVVTPAAPGRTVSPASLADVAVAAGAALSSATTTVQFVDAAPAVSTAAARRVADRANALVARKVAVSDGDGDGRVASARTKASWVSIPTTNGVPGAPTVDAAKVRAWVTAAAEDAEVEPDDGLRYVDSSGAVRAVKDEPRDGRTVSNTDALARAATAALGDGKPWTGRFEFTTQRAEWRERRVARGAERLAYPAAEGEKWIDVDLGSHTMTAYVGATVVRGPIRMVDGSPEKPTVTGTFEVYHKRPLMTMRGNNADGTRYETPNVPWTSFFHRGFALHGAPWRTSFGYSASHGCINLPVDVAKWVYDFAAIGTTVTVHR